MGKIWETMKWAAVKQIEKQDKDEEITTSELETAIFWVDAGGA